MARKCVEMGCEALPPQEAATLFGVSPSSVRAAKAKGRLHPVFEMVIGGGPAVAYFKLADLIDYFEQTGGGKADAKMLAKMRENGTTCYVQGYGGWLLLSEKRAIR